MEAGKQAGAEVVLEDDGDVVETDPEGRYYCYRELVGRGKFKACHKAFDSQIGIDVAWSKIAADCNHLSEKELEAVVQDIQKGLELDHPNIIKCFKCWEDTSNHCINLITELFTSGNLRQYRNLHKHLDLKAVKRMGRQILRGLQYLHSMQPALTHGDLRCDKIYVNGHSGEIKIGDLGTATLISHRWDRLTGCSPASAAAAAAVAAAEAAEEEAANPSSASALEATPPTDSAHLPGMPLPMTCSSDIFAFGLCILELLTLKQLDPLHCADWPKVVAQVPDEEARAFITKCLQPSRPAAEELLEDPFLSAKKAAPSSAAPTEGGGLQQDHSALSASAKDLQDVIAAAKERRSTDEHEEATSSGSVAVGKLRGEDYIFEFAGKVKDGKMHFRLVMTQAVPVEASDGAPPFMRTIDFVFDPDDDTVDKLSGEISETFNLSPTDTEICAAALREWLAKEMPGLVEKRNE